MARNFGGFSFLRFFQRSPKIIPPPKKKKNTALRNHVCSITTRLFNSETKRYTITMYAYRSTVWKSILFLLHPEYTYLTRMKILSMLGTGYFLKINSVSLRSAFFESKNVCDSRVTVCFDFLTAVHDHESKIQCSGFCYHLFQWGRGTICNKITTLNTRGPVQPSQISVTSCSQKQAFRP